MYVVQNRAVWTKIVSKIVSNPLVVILCIGKYDGMASLIESITIDYRNMVHVFHDIFGYSIFYKNGVNNKSILIPPVNKSDHGVKNDINNQKNCQCVKKKYYKNEWLSEKKCDDYNNNNGKCNHDDCDGTFDEINEFCVDVQSELNDKNNNKNYDGLIFILSCHGESNGVILDSKAQEYPLQYIYAKFNNKYCQSLISKPKLFFIDCCRGSMREKAAKFNPQNNDNNNAMKAKGTEIDNENKKKKENAIDLSNQVHQESNFYKLFANPDGWASIDSLKGGVLIRSIKKVFLEDDKILSTPLHDIFLQISSISHKDSKYVSIQRPESTTTLDHKVMFAKYGTNMHHNTIKNNFNQISLPKVVEEEKETHSRERKQVNVSANETLSNKNNSIQDVKVHVVETKDNKFINELIITTESVNDTKSDKLWIAIVVVAVLVAIIMVILIVVT